MDESGPEVAPKSDAVKQQEGLQVVNYDLHQKKLDELHNPQTQEMHPNPLNLNPLAFGILVVLLTALIIGGIVGGTVGGILASKNTYLKRQCTGLRISPSSTPTTNPIASTSLPTNYVPLAPTAINPVKLSCPVLDGTVHTTVNNDQFKYECYTDYGGGDFISILAYTTSDCVLACSNARYFNSSCIGVTFNAQVGFEFGAGDQYSNCWQKTTLSTPYVNQTILRMSATLQY